MYIKTQDDKKTVTLTAEELIEAVVEASRFVCEDMKKTCREFDDTAAYGYMIHSAQIANMLTEMYFGG